MRRQKNPITLKLAQDGQEGGKAARFALNE